MSEELLPRAGDAPRLDNLLRLAERTFKSWDFWFWFLWSGSAESEEIRNALYPLPPAHLTQRVVGGMSAREYLESGLIDARRIVDCLTLAGFDPAVGGARLLDFGCGCGRLLQCLARYGANNDFAGVDVDSASVAWCNENIDFATFAAIGTRPPLPFDSRELDAIYSFSVFSHLDEQRHLDWLGELARVLRPGGILVATIMGSTCIDKYRSGRPEPPTPEVLEERFPDLQRDGFAFFPYGDLATEHEGTRAYFDQLDLDQYGSTFILESYVRERWTPDFEILEFLEAPDGWQDYVIMKRR